MKTHINIEAERKLFEESYRRRHGIPDYVRMYRHTEGVRVDEYCSSYQQASWEAWQDRASLAAPQEEPVSVLNGWKLVPNDPTDAMQMAGAESIRFDTTAINKIWTGNKVYRAMIAAARVPPRPAAPVFSDENRSDALQDLQFVAGFEAGWNAGVDGNEALLSKVRERSKPARTILAKVQQNEPQIIPEIIPAPAVPALSDKPTIPQPNLGSIT